MAKRERKVKAQDDVEEQVPETVEEAIEEQVEEAAEEVVEEKQIQVQIETPPQPKKIRFKNLSGTFRFGNKLIKPNQVFEAHLSEIPKSFLRDLEQLDEVEEIPEQISIPEFQYKMEPDEDLDGFFNVVDKQGKILNEEPLTEVEASELLNTLR
jgi:hypothetical protein